MLRRPSTRFLAPPSINVRSLRDDSCAVQNDIALRVGCSVLHFLRDVVILNFPQHLVILKRDAVPLKNRTKSETSNAVNGTVRAA